MSIRQTPGRIYLADDRGKLENEVHQRFSTFNFAEYQQEHKQPFGHLCTFNDEILPAGGKLIQVATTGGFVLLIPITGAIECTQLSQNFEAEAGQVLLLPVEKGTVVEILNPYPSDWVNFLHVEIKAEERPGTSTQTFSFELENTPNQMIVVIPTSYKLPFSLHIGRFNGREEMLHTLNPAGTLFAFVIGGAFELQNRLLHERDGLALWDTGEVDAEALSNGAVLLLLELDG